MEIDDKTRMQLLDRAIYFLRRAHQGSASISITAFDQCRKQTDHWHEFAYRLGLGDMLGAADVLEYKIKPDYV